MKTKIYCESTGNGMQAFYLTVGSYGYYLFSQSYRRGVQQYFSKGVSIDQSMNYSRAHRDDALIRTMTKIPMYVNYIEKEYGIEVFEQTKKKNGNNYRFSATKCA